MKIGVISDTHDHFDPKIPGLFAGVEHILHGGDIGAAHILAELEHIAPVTAVSGNTDWDPSYRETEVVELAGRKFLLHHIVDPHRLEDSLQRRLQTVQPDVVIFGHTHKPFCEQIGGTLFFNPGYAGKQRFSLPRSLAVLEITATGIQHAFTPL